MEKSKKTHFMLRPTLFSVLVASLQSPLLLPLYVFSFPFLCSYLCCSFVIFVFSFFIFMFFCCHICVLLSLYFFECLLPLSSLLLLEKTRVNGRQTRTLSNIFSHLFPKYCNMIFSCEILKWSNDLFKRLCFEDRHGNHVLYSFTRPPQPHSNYILHMLLQNWVLLIQRLTWKSSDFFVVQSLQHIYISNSLTDISFEKERGSWEHTILYFV